MSDMAVAGIGKSSSNVYLSLHGALPITLGQRHGVRSTFITSSYSSFNLVSQHLYCTVAGDAIDIFQTGSVFLKFLLRLPVTVWRSGVSR